MFSTRLSLIAGILVCINGIACNQPVLKFEATPVNTSVGDFLDDSSDPVSSRTPIACELVTEGGSCDFIVTPKQGVSTGISQMVNVLPGDDDTFVNTFDATAAGVEPGDRVCLRAGEYPWSKLQVKNAIGASDSPVEFVNCDGRFVIGNDIDPNENGAPAYSRGIEIYYSKYVKISGAGSRDEKYGIKVAGTNPGVGGAIVIANLSSDVEIEYTEIAHAGFAGIMAKTEPGCTDTDPNSFRGGFVMENCVFHDNYIHDVVGEGFYIGYSFHQGNTGVGACPGVPIYSHDVRGTRIYNNTVERSGCEAIQVGSGEDTLIHDNTIVGFGVSPFAASQNNGIQVGLGTSGKVYNNYVINPDPSFMVGSGIIIQGTKDTEIYNNTLVNPGSGMYVHHDTGEDRLGNQQSAYGLPNYTLKIYRNLIYNPTGNPNATHKDGRGIWLANDQIPITLTDNLILMNDPQTAGLSLEQHLLMYTVFDHMVPWSTSSQGLTGPNITQSGLVKAHKSFASDYIKDVSVSDQKLRAINPLYGAQ